MLEVMLFSNKSTNHKSFILYIMREIMLFSNKSTNQKSFSLYTRREILFFKIIDKHFQLKSFRKKCVKVGNIAHLICFKKKVDSFLEIKTKLSFSRTQQFPLA